MWNVRPSNNLFEADRARLSLRSKLNFLSLSTSLMRYDQASDNDKYNMDIYKKIKIVYVTPVLNKIWIKQLNSIMTLINYLLIP